MNTRTTYTSLADEAVRVTLPTALDQIGNQAIANKFRKLPRITTVEGLFRANKVGAEVLLRVVQTLVLAHSSTDSDADMPGGSLENYRMALLNAYWTARCTLNAVEHALKGEPALN